MRTQLLGFFNNVSFLTLRQPPLPPGTAKSKGNRVFWLSLGGWLFYSSNFCFLAMWPQLSEELMKGMVLKTGQRFLVVRLGGAALWRSPHPKQAWDCQLWLTAPPFTSHALWAGGGIAWSPKVWSKLLVQAPGRCLQGNASGRAHCFSGFLLSYLLAERIFL